MKTKTRWALVGTSGRMGQEILSAAKKQKFGELCWSGSTRSKADLAELMSSEPDVIIDFSQPASTLGWMNTFKKAGKKLPAAIIGTTGFTNREKKRFLELAGPKGVKNKIALVPNTSLGVYATQKAIAAISSVLDDRYTLEMRESHHSKKKDAPSGTALYLADAASQKVGFHSVRAGSDPGTHTMEIWGPSEKIELTHRAESRALFAEGALFLASVLLKTRKKGPFQGIDQLLD